ncbi:MAG: hypothetical protein WD023_01470 [Ilumatobacteraceae bacterium]
MRAQAQDETGLAALDDVEAETETEIYGTGGHLRIWPQFTPDHPAPDDYVHCTLPMYAAQMADFVRCCHTGDTPVASAEVGIVALDIVERVMAQQPPR